MKRLLLCSSALCIALGLAAQPGPWHYRKDNPATGKHVVRIDAESFDQTADGRTKLHNMTARLYNADGTTFKTINSKEAVIDEQRGTLVYGPGLKTMVSLKN